MLRTLLTNPACISAWRAEAKRTASHAVIAHNAQYVQNALAVLDELYCLKNPEQKNPLHMRQAAFALFLEASLAGYPLAMFFEGLARKEGFGCQVDAKTGEALIQVAGSRKCAEALNYLALCYLKQVSITIQDVLTALTMLRDAAHDGHAQALSNFRTLAEEYRKRRQARFALISYRPKFA